MINGRMNYYVITGSMLLSATYVALVLWFLFGIRYGFILIPLGFVNFLATPFYKRGSKS